MPTRLLYLDDSQRTEADATIARVHDDGGDTTVVLDETIFYPQGGGQPTDRGRLTTARGALDVRRVAFVNGEVLHIGPAEGTPAPGEGAHLTVDPGVRRQHALLHTGGHLVMTAVDRLVGYHPTKGYHFPNGPYVEFDRPLPVPDRETFAARVQEAMDRTRWSPRASPSGPVRSWRPSWRRCAAVSAPGTPSICAPCSCSGRRARSGTTTSARASCSRRRSAGSAPSSAAATPRPCARSTSWP
ncbi:hypothetical protein HUT06_24225 [Actinomadura sp. NAK00032]|uniref:alanine--tRNA ligase-related protein n=1 Tax=Actinomadura sp. NAK00032 TaxID=2742128 RepID=UPI00158FB1F5|nr:alanine--tRNA ligase-related protein [Actinomadura sp. NAK00032]QKW36747.1 hypothetical protein HUT06_24225 [Actinomadura sp. NAK00032]